MAPTSTADVLVRRAPNSGTMGIVILDALRRRWPSPVVWTPGLNRFAVAQALSGAADALVAVSLAGSLFFSLSPEASRQQVLLYLLINMAPYVVLAPLIGPAIDRFRLGHRWIAAILFACRAVCAAGLAFTLLDLGAVLLRPGPARRRQGVRRRPPGARARPRRRPGPARRRQLPPGPTQRDRRRRRRRDRRRRCWPSARPPPAPALAVRRSSSAPPSPRSGCPATAPGAPRRSPASVEYEELHAPTIVATSWAFTVVRAAVGFFVFGLAFALRRASEPAWMYGATVAAYGVGTFVGNVVAPLLRRRYGEDRLTAGSLVVLAVVAAFGALGPSRPLVLLVAVVARRRGVGRPPGLRLARPDPRADRRRTAARSPASRPGSSSAGSPAPSPPRPSPSRSASASASSPSA